MRKDAFNKKVTTVSSEPFFTFAAELCNLRWDKASKSMRFKCFKDVFASVMFSLFCLLYGLEVVAGRADALRDLDSRGWVLYIIPVLCAGVQFVVIYFVLRRKCLHAQKSAKNGWVNLRVIGLVLAVGLTYCAPIASVELANAALLNSVDLPSRNLSLEQFPELVNAAAKKLGFRVVCYWGSQTLRIVFRKGDDRAKVVRGTITELLEAPERGK